MKQADDRTNISRGSGGAIPEPFWKKCGPTSGPRKWEAVPDHVPRPQPRPIRTLMTFTWEYYLKHPEFMSLVNGENLHRARHVQKKSSEINELQRPGLYRQCAMRVQQILDSGAWRPATSGQASTRASYTLIPRPRLGALLLDELRFIGEVIFASISFLKRRFQKRLEFNIDGCV